MGEQANSRTGVEARPKLKQNNMAKIMVLVSLGNTTCSAGEKSVTKLLNHEIVMFINHINHFYLLYLRYPEYTAAPWLFLHTHISEMSVYTHFTARWFMLEQPSKVLCGTMQQIASLLETVRKLEHLTM